MEITASLFGDMLPASLQQQPTQGYSPDYYQQMQQYYSGYLPGQSLDTTALQDWYSSSANLPYGGTTFAKPAPAAVAPTPGLFDNAGMSVGEGAATPTGSSDSGFDPETGLYSSGLVDSGALQGISALASLLGIPFAGLLGEFAPSISKAINDINYGRDVTKNTAYVAETMGLNPNDPENAPAISAAIDSLSSAPTGQVTATTGPTGTGGMAAQASQIAAAEAVAKGLSDAEVAAAAQQAADAVLRGETPVAPTQDIPEQISMLASQYEQYGFSQEQAFNQALQDVWSQVAPDIAETMPTITEQAPVAVDTLFSPSYDSYSYSDPSESYGGGDTTSSSTADSTASDNSGVGGW